MINVALPKGRLGDSAYALFEAAGYPCPSMHEGGRKLIFENEAAGVRFFSVKPSDVAIYVEHGAADIGVAGLDILLESEPDVFDLGDMGIGKCRFAVAGKKGFEIDRERPLKVATKFVNITKKYFAETGVSVEIFKLNGSIELAPILGMTDVIVDIVETGATLRENGLEVIREIMPISAHLIANKSSFRFKSDEIERLKNALVKG
ncbi:MAG: ATP phosphoribosyltransferase [Clostridia bacterium]|nr:ATP phosphoribosyltransferase [Clostridia bacterium]